MEKEGARTGVMGDSAPRGSRSRGFRAPAKRRTHDMPVTAVTFMNAWYASSSILRTC